jgi:hypothetical protein
VAVVGKGWRKGGVIKCTRAMKLSEGEVIKTKLQQNLGIQGGWCRADVSGSYVPHVWGSAGVEKPRFVHLPCASGNPLSSTTTTQQRMEPNAVPVIRSSPSNNRMDPCTETALRLEPAWR